MFTGAFSSSSAWLGLLTVPSYKKFLVANALVVFGDIKASRLFLFVTTCLRPKALSISLRDFRVNSIILHTEKFRSM